MKDSPWLRRSVKWVDVVSICIVAIAFGIVAAVCISGDLDVRLLVDFKDIVHETFLVDFDDTVTARGLDQLRAQHVQYSLVQ